VVGASVKALARFAEKNPKKEKAQEGSGQVAV